MYGHSILYTFKEAMIVVIQKRISFLQTSEVLAANRVTFSLKTNFLIVTYPQLSMKVNVYTAHLHNLN